MSAYDISFKDFYAVISSYLLENRLVDKIDFDESRLVVHESCSDMWFEFVLRVHRMDDKGGEKGKIKG